LIRQFDQVPQQENVVAQLYIKKPLLIEGFKFDLRLYILVTSIRPLRSVSQSVSLDLTPWPRSLSQNVPLQRWLGEDMH
jgi:hypothetical protein